MNLTILLLTGTALLLATMPARAEATRPSSPASAPGAGANAADLDVLRTRFVASVIPTDPAELARLHRTAAGHLASLRADGTWADVEYGDTRASFWRTAVHVTRAVLMARSFRAATDAGEDAVAVRDGAVRALGTWLDRDPQSPNWWWNQISVPQQMGEALLLLDDAAPPDLVARGVNLMRRATWAKWTGQNLVWGVTIQAKRGCIERDSAVVAEAFERLYREVVVAPPGREGIQADFSFHQHGPQLYSGGYGLGFANDVALHFALAWGTRFAPPPEVTDVLVAYLLDGQQWMVRGNAFDYSAVGREIVRKGKSIGGLGSAVARLAALDGVPRRDELATFAARFHGDASAPPLVGHRHFWRSDYATHHRPGYFASVRMYSDRLLNTETVNDEGRTSHHLADGAMLVYRSGDEYKDVFPAWDWKKVPGTTAEQHDLNTEAKGTGIKGTTDFVGGASDGTYGIAAMDLARGALTARKAWVFLDDVIVCLGAGIACPTDNAVVTSVNQCLLDGDITASGRTAPLEAGSRLLKAVEWVHHDGVAYVFPRPADVHVINETRAGRWTDIGVSPGDPVELPVFGLWLDHGARASGGTYEYLVMPDVAADIVAARVRETGVDVLGNTPELQAVLHRELGLLAVAFWEPGRVEGGDGWAVAVDQPCLLMVRRDAAGTRVMVSNPRNRALDVRVSVNGVERTVRLPDGARAGSSVTEVIGSTARENGR